MSKPARYVIEYQIEANSLSEAIDTAYDLVFSLPAAVNAPAIKSIRVKKEKKHGHGD